MLAAACYDLPAVNLARSTAWVAVASGVLGILDLVSTLLCIRLWVSTADFGAATLAIALFPILDRLGGMGLGAALIKEPGDEVGESSVFWLGLGIASAVAVALLVAHPWLGAAFGQPIVASLLAAYGIRLVIQQLAIPSDARMRRALRFHELSVIRIVAGFCEQGAKLGLAAAGEPVWCFGIGPIVNSAVMLVALQLRCPWRPRFALDRAVVVRAARFTAALSGGELLYYVYTSVDYLVVGAAFGDAAVGAYRLAYELVLDVVRLVSMVSADVAFPWFIRTPREKLGDEFLRFTRQNAIVLAPFLAFTALEATPLLDSLYGNIANLGLAGTAATILCIVGGLRALGFVIPPLLAAIGLPRRVLAYNLLATIILPIAFVIAGRVGGDFTAVAWAWAIGYPLAFVALAWMALPEIGVTARRYLRAIGGVAVCAIAATAAGLATRAVYDELNVVGAVMLAVYLGLLAVIERVTPRSILRSFRATADGSTTAAPVPAAARPPDM